MSTYSLTFYTERADQRVMFHQVQISDEDLVETARVDPQAPDTEDPAELISVFVTSVLVLCGMRHDQNLEYQPLTYYVTFVQDGKLRGELAVPWVIDITSFAGDADAIEYEFCSFAARFLSERGIDITAAQIAQHNPYDSAWGAREEEIAIDGPNTPDELINALEQLLGGAS